MVVKGNDGRSKWCQKYITLNPPDSQYKKCMILDLDDTLIPTTWLMTQYRNLMKMSSSKDVIEEIRLMLIKSDLYENLNLLMSKIISLNVEKIYVVTNAAQKTVEQFYFSLIMPELKEIFVKFDIEVISTSYWTNQMGLPPPQEREKEYRDYFTIAKKHAFIYVLKKFSIHFGVDSINLISVGDQYCEMSAASSLALKKGIPYINESNEKGLIKIEYVTLIMILCQKLENIENSIEMQQTPKSFSKQLKGLMKNIELSLTNELRTECPAKEIYKPPGIELKDYVDDLKKKVPCWIPLDHSMAVCSTKSVKFVSEYPFYLPLSYQNNTTGSGWNKAITQL